MGSLPIFCCTHCIIYISFILMVKDKGLFKHKTSTWYQSCSPILLISFSLFSSSYTMITTPSSSHILPGINESHIFTINTAAQAPLRLTSSNYLSWKIQFETLFIGYNFLGALMDLIHVHPKL